MDDLRILTGKVCDVARTAGRFLKEERKSFRREAVEESMRTTMCPMWTRSLKTHCRRTGRSSARSRFYRGGGLGSLPG